MIKVIYVIAISFLFLFLFAVGSVQAQQVETNLDTCNSTEYCDGDKTTWVRKSNCRLANQFNTGSDRSKEIRFNSGKNCVCHYERLPNSCGNRGGIQDARINSVDSVFGRINPPTEIGSLGNGVGAISNLISRVIQLIYTIAGIGFLIFFLWNALQLIISGGDKDKVAGARKHITWSIIGITLLALAFPLLKVLESFIGIKFFF